MEWTEEIWLKQGRCSSALATMDITEGSQRQAHEDHQKYWAAREETPLFGSSSLLTCSCLYSPHKDTAILAHWTFDLCVCFGH